MGGEGVRARVGALLRPVAVFLGRGGGGARARRTHNKPTHTTHTDPHNYPPCLTTHASYTYYLPYCPGSSTDQVYNSKGDFNGCGGNSEPARLRSALGGGCASVLFGDGDGGRVPPPPLLTPLALKVHPQRLGTLGPTLKFQHRQGVDPPR